MTCHCFSYLQIRRFLCHSSPSLHLIFSLHSPALLVVSRITGVSAQHVNEIPGQYPIQLFGRVKLIVPQKRVGRIGRNVGADGVVGVAMVLVAGNVGRRGSIQVGGWVVVDVEDLEHVSCGRLYWDTVDPPSCTRQTERNSRRDNGWRGQLRMAAGI